MSTNSNIYAQKVFAEHPLGLWALDEDTHFLSAILESDRDFSNWSRSGVPGDSFTTQSPDIFPYSKFGIDVNKIYATGLASTGSFEVVSNSTFSIDGVGETFTVGFYYFKTTPYITSIEIGYKIGGSVGWSSPILTQTFFDWDFVSATFKQNTIAGATGPEITNAKIVIKFNWTIPSGEVRDVGILVDGLSAGIWSEEHDMDYLGAVPETLPAYIEGITGNTHGVKANKHGSDEGFGYYVVGSDGRFSARNASMPMVYGAFNSTILRPGVNGEPSIILPGNGFLLDSEKYKIKTFEGWFRIDAQTTELRKIVGPISTQDGLFVTGPFLVLKIGKNYKSYFVGEWNRPMLIQMYVSENSAQLTVNGDVAISMNIDMKNEILADINIDGYGNVNDWIGIYAYDDVPVVEVDCIAIYPYQVDTVMAQRRFVMGEAVRFPESLVTAYGGQSIVPDYAFAKYASDQSYGSNQKSDWEQGELYNFETKSGPLKSPVYKLPEIRNSDAIIEAEYYSDLNNYLHAISSTESYFTMKPGTITTKWDNGTHIYFDTIEMIKDKTDMIYTVIKTDEYPTSPQTIFKIMNKQNGDYIKANLISRTENKNRIEYVFKYGSDAETILYVSSEFTTGSKKIAGLSISKMCEYGIDNVSNFFANIAQLSMYVGSQNDYTEIFWGSIYTIGLGSQYDLSKVSTEFNIAGFAETLSTTMINNTSSYNFVASSPFRSLSLPTLDDIVVPEISTSSYWKEDIPLSFFAKTINNEDNTSQQLLDFIQVNFDYAHPIAYTESGIHDTSDSLVRVYVTFQTNTSGTIDDLSKFSNYIGTPEEYYIEVGSEWYTTKYEVVNGTVIGVPQNVNINDISLVVHLEAKVSSSLQYPVSIRSLQLSSHAMNSLSDTPITTGTKFGVDLIPFGHNSNGINPMVITKGSDPYYYLSDQSGLKIAGPINQNRGYYINVNPGESDLFNIGGIQTTFKIEEDGLSAGDIKMFSVSKDLANDDLRFYLEPVNNSNTRARIYAVLFDGTNETAYTDLKYYINGSFAHDPVITMNEWVTIGINFTSLYSDEALTEPTIVNLNGVAGRINFYGPMLINSFSYFQLRKTEEEQRQIISRRWAEIEFTPGTTPTLNTWGSWKNASAPFKVWSDLSETGAESNTSGLNAQELYQSFIGANNIVFETETSQIKPNKFRYDFHANFVTTNILLSAT